MARPQKKYNLSVVEAEAKLKIPQIVIELNNDQEVYMEPSQLWPDEAFELANTGKLNELTRLLLGDQYDTYKGNGGTDGLLQIVVAEHSKFKLGESSAS